MVRKGMERCKLSIIREHLTEEGAWKVVASFLVMSLTLSLIFVVVETMTAILTLTKWFVESQEDYVSP